LNNHQKGYRRDNDIISALEEWQVLDTDQLQLLFFSDVSLRMAQRRLQRLTELKKIHRARNYPGQPYYYYIDKKPGQVDHKLGVNWVRMWLQRSLKSWESLSCWQYEPVYKGIRPDALVAIKNTVKDKMRLSFIERECDTNPCKKVKLYNDFYSNSGYGGSWWEEQTERFPSILLVVETSGRMETVKKLIEKDNPNGLEFKVYLLDQIISEVKGAVS